MAVYLQDGDIITAGNCYEPVSIQSVSKVFVLALALGKVGDQLWQRVGREPSGSACDSILQLEHEKGHSLLGTKMLEGLVSDLGWSVFL